MTQDNIILTDEEALSDWCVEMDSLKEGKLLQEIIRKLKGTMREQNLVSLSAPQVGYKKRVFCLRFGKNDYRTFVNPVIQNNSQFTMSRETCSSIPGKTFIRPRFGNISVFYTTPLGEVKSANLMGKAAIQFQHALDHLNGLLLSDVGLEIDELFDQATEDEQAEILKMYAESLDIRQKELDAEISDDKELSDILEASRFINSVKSGETLLDKSLDAK